MTKRKMMISGLIGICILGFVCFFIIKHDKKTNLGNTITKSQEKLEEYILNIHSYEAKVEVTIHSNKTANKYLLKQQYHEPNLFTQEVIEPENIAGLKTILDGNNLRIENTTLSLTEFYENYPYINENSLSLYDFIQDYKEDPNAQYQKTEQEIILKVKPRQLTPYVWNKTLYLDIETGLPKKLEVQDDNQNTLVYILYKEIEINSVNKESVIAFQLFDGLNVSL